ncbi:hypothetical protein EDB83DRAFT_1009892 [Lactarius deliciosus]|nr:hypothetical protein EDB83DRAFT_1009892 [Lactarius deliciosus]
MLSHQHFARALLQISFDAMRRLPLILPLPRRRTNLTSWEQSSNSQDHDTRGIESGSTKELGICRHSFGASVERGDCETGCMPYGLDSSVHAFTTTVADGHMLRTREACSSFQLAMKSAFNLSASCYPYFQACHVLTECIHAAAVTDSPSLLTLDPPPSHNTGVYRDGDVPKVHVRRKGLSSIGERICCAQLDGLVLVEHIDVCLGRSQPQRRVYWLKRKLN